MSSGLALGIESEAPELVDAGLLIAPFFASDQPLRGIAGRVDWRLCGLISEVLRAGHANGQPGDALLVATDGRLRSERVLLIGLGVRENLKVPGLIDACADGIQRALEVSALNLVYAVESHAGVGPDQMVPGMVRAAAQVVKGAGVTAQLRFLVNPKERGRAREALVGAVSDGNSEDLTLNLAPPPLNGPPSDRRQNLGSG